MDLNLSISMLMVIIGFTLIISEMITGASAFFFAVLGLIFLIGGIGIELSGMTDFGLIMTFIASVATCAFFSICVWSKRLSKIDHANRNLNGYEGQKFISKLELPTNSTAKSVNVFGISFDVTNVGEAVIAEGDEAIVIKESVRRLYVKNVSEHTENESVTP